MTALSWVAIAMLTVCAAAAGAFAADSWHRRRRQREDEERRELEELARRQAIGDARSADAAWQRAHRSYNPSLYVHAGVLRTLAGASHQRAQAIHAMLRTGQPVNRTVLADEWQPPFRPGAERDERPAPDRWARFDRAAKTLGAIATTPDSDPQAIADAHDELSRAALELASQLEHAAPEQPRPKREVLCSFCGRSNRHPDISRMISGPGINICDDCVSLCVEIIEDPDGTG